MRFRLWQRLFLAFAALSVLALGGLAAWQQQSFRRGFLGYLDEVALERLQPARVRLADAYAEHGNWDFLRDRPDRFGELIDDRRGSRNGAAPDEDRPAPPHDEHERARRDDTQSSPPRDDASPRDMPASPPPPRDDPAPPFDDRGAAPEDTVRRPGEARPPHPPHGPPDLMPRLELVDANGAHVVGHAEVSQPASAIAIDYEGKHVGALRLAAQPRLSEEIDIAFARDQLGDVLIAAVVVLMLALLLAFALARGLLKPIHALASGTRSLAAGDYGRRIAVERSDELGRLADDFNHLAATLEHHRDARRRWGADIAHELRTPLSVLRGEIQALQDGVRAPTAAALDSLDAECNRLGALIEDLYQLSLADAGALDYRFEIVDFGALVRDALDLQRSACSDAGLSLDGEVDANASIRGDARRLAQLLDNLIANARRYTDAPGRIRVEVKTLRDNARLIVEDTAPGVPNDALPRLFERLFRVETSRSRASGGAGLGLAICRAIVEAHGGCIDAQPSTLGGLRVVVELPRGAA